jgi:hypothetical protein
MTKREKILSSQHCALSRRSSKATTSFLAAANRTFSGLHDNFLPMSSKTRSIFQQLRASKARARPSVKKGVNAAKAASNQASGKISGSVLGSVTGLDMPSLANEKRFLNLQIGLLGQPRCFHSSYLIFWLTKYAITMRKMKALSLSIQSMN